MIKAEIKVHELTAGWLTQDEYGYHFSYDPVYLQLPDADFVTAFNTLNLDKKQQDNIFRKMKMQCRLA